MDLPTADGIAADSSPDPCKKRRMELPLKKRYQRQVSTDLPALSIINRNGSPTDDRASSDDSALPKTPCSAQSSSSSADIDDCSEFALDFTLPHRSRAKSRSAQDDRSKKENGDHDGIDHGFESASTSSVLSVQEEPLDLTEKPHPAPSEIRRRAHQSESTAATLAPFPMGLFGPGFLPFSMAPLDSSSTHIPDPLYPNFCSQSISGSSLAASMGPSSASKRLKATSAKQLKKADTASKCNTAEYSTSPIASKSVNALLNAAADEQYNESEEDMLLNKLRRNYKNMTVERRMEANARERTRVHTIGAAFDRLRKLIPSSTSDQKLSKLSILRIACRYIMLLASMNGLDYSLEQHGYTIEECVDMLTDTVGFNESPFRMIKPDQACSEDLIYVANETLVLPLGAKFWMTKLDRAVFRRLPQCHLAKNQFLSTPAGGEVRPVWEQPSSQLRRQKKASQVDSRSTSRLESFIFSKPGYLDRRRLRSRLADGRA